MPFSSVLPASTTTSTISTTNFNGTDCQDAKQTCMDEEEKKILEAEHVFVLMKKEYRISRNIRAQWYFGHLNKTINVLPRKNLAEFTEEIGVVSVLPKTCPEDWNPEESHKYQYRVTPFTRTMFFARQYRVVFCLDLSSSVGTVDIQHGSILFDEIYQVLRKCTKGAVKPFEIPGSGFLFRPNIYVTVIAHMPFYRSGVNQTEKDNTKDVVVGDASDNCKHQMTIAPDINTVDMLRYGILALQLLPENSGAGEIEVRLVLPWKSNIILEYVILAAWPPRSKNESGHPSCSPAQPESCHCELIVEGSYDFLHDVTCVKKPIKSFYREAVVCNFWNTLKNLSHTDQLLAHLHSFTHNPVFYTIPDSIKNGVPLFCLPPNASKPILFSKNSSHTQFASFWRPICMLDINVWQKWMHTHRIGLVLQHDEPLPKNVHLPNSSGRYGQVQSRQALTLVDALLRDHSSFVLIENHSYIKFLFGELEKPPTSFYIIRVISKASCMVIRLAFLGGTPGYKRNMIVNELQDKLLNLKFPKRGRNKEVQVQTVEREDSLRTGHSSEALTQSKSCCVLLRKPVEKILIRYERMPSDFLSSIPSSLLTNHGTRKQGVSIPEQAVTNILTTLSRYLHHHRWIWTVQNSPSTPLPLAAVARILSTLTKRRLQERFHFGHSCSGIINMVTELDMQSEDHVLRETDTQVHINSDVEKETHPCVVQYILFPPYSNTKLVDSISDDEDGEIEMAEADGELQLITECWVEPQHGVVTIQLPYCNFLQGLNYHKLVNAFHLVDLECISALVTFEHLCLMCQNMKVPSPRSGPLGMNSSTCSSKADQQQSILSAARSTPDVMLSQISILNHKPEPTITQVPFSFDLLNLLPKCQQAELLFSTLIQDINSPDNDDTEEKDISNIILFHFLMENLKKIHDREIILGPREIEQLPRKIFERERDPKAPSIPFLYQCGTDIFVTGDSKDSSPLLKQGCQNGQYTLKDDYDDDNIVNWRCFAKYASPHHVLLIVIPASYKDLKRLMLTKLEMDESQLSARSVRLVKKVVDANSSSQRDEAYKIFQDGETKEDVEGKNESVDDATLPLPVEHMVKNDKPENISTNQAYGCVILPVYIYDCHLGSVINQLVYEENFKKCQDIYQDMTFKIDGSYSEAESIGFSCYESQQSQNSKQPSPECRSEEGETYSDKLYLKRHCNLVEAAFSKSFVYALFRCLHHGYHLDKQDVEAVVDGICQENLLEVDITHFLQMICGHVKDFKVKVSMEETHKSFEKSSSKKSLEQDRDNKDGDASMIREGESWRKDFPLDLLRRHHPCEPLQQLHSSIKQKFTKVFQTFFHPIPSLPDFYFFNFSEQQVHQVEYNEEAEGINELSDDDENAEKSETEADSQMEHVRFVPDQELNDFPTKDGEAPSCEEASSLSEDTSVGRQSVLSSLEDEDEMNNRQNLGLSIPPLFVHLTCSVRTNHNVGNCSLKSLPTCLGEVISSLEEPGTNIDLDDLQITLDVLCLTLHPEVEELVESDKTVRTVSYCSTSPMPESEPLKSIDEDEDDLSASHSDIQTEIACHQLSHLPSFQQETVKMCIQRIEWMFQDEIASAALDTFPIMPSTLDFVVNHVENSRSFLTCLKDEVPLHFVFGPDLSLDKFIQ
ncbi:KICSTOR complex protein SZT2-like, partial [Limulus polyphemus]|uniref:KICSTOR complex protein SZT2-like n=1 Tax=Limulus polyphemus TaxID=6850 RepID=A0ABM1T606_LIMPO